jgi:hypothetical protein
MEIIMDQHSAIVVFTGRSFNQIVQEGGSQSWKLDPNRARRCEFLVCTQNRYAEEWADPEASHGAAFMVARISGIELSKEATKTPRYIIRVSEVARFDRRNVWDGSRNPVRYTTLEQLGIDLDSLTFEQVHGPAGAASHVDVSTVLKDEDQQSRFSRRQDDPPQVGSLSVNSSSDPGGQAPALEVVRPLTIQEAKAGVAAMYGVSPDAVTITITA